MKLQFKSTPFISNLQKESNATHETEQQFVSALRKNVNAYFKDNGISVKSNLSMALQTGAMLSFYILPFIAILLIPMAGWVAIFPAIVMGIGIAGIGMCIMHDALHGAYSSKEWVNKLLGDTML